MYLHKLADACVADVGSTRAILLVRPLLTALSRTWDKASSVRISRVLC